MELTVTLPPDTDVVATLGSAERNLKLIREALGVSASARDGAVRLSGEGGAVNHAAEVLSDLAEAARKRRPLSREALLDRLHQASVSNRHAAETADVLGADVHVRGRRIEGRSEGQRRYLEAIGSHDMVFCTGPAGTGKTYLAVAAAVAMMRRGQVRKMVLVRPAVEAGERLGFLPGDMQQKVNPYLRPLLDALNDMMPFEQVERFMHSDLIEIVPLAFMRGRTLNDAAIILDEAQNTTRSQMLMFLTRMGESSKMIVAGDTSQVDLDDPTESGLVDAARRLKRVPGVAFITLDRTDIVRHSLVQRVVDAYGREPDGRDRESVDFSPNSASRPADNG